MLDFLLSGFLLGLASGFAPGSLLVLVIMQTLRHNTMEGIKVSLAPVITDLPIVLTTLFILAKLSDFKIIIGCISIMGGCYILYLSYESIKIKGLKIKFGSVKPHSFKKGIITNFLNPNPYLFWLTVGSPMILKASNVSFSAVIAFVGTFYILLVGLKMLLAVIVGRSREFLEGRIYIFIMRFLGVLLFLFSILLFRDGLMLLGILHNSPG